jgi:PBP1b-binding outer membrane lipoprotein LpoB
MKKMKKMKKILAVLLLAISINGFAQQKEIEWHTDVNKAINISVQTGKPLLCSLQEVIGADGVKN